MSKVLSLAGGVLFVNGLFMLVLSNLNLGAILTFLLGAFLLMFGIFYEKVKHYTQKGVLKAVRNIIIILLCAEVFLVGFIAVSGQTDNVNYDEDVVIVLGAGVRGDRVTVPLKMRLDVAVKYHEKNPDALIIVTGGKGFQETVTEASAMEKYLVKNGVPKDIIIKEEKATSTNENMRFSKKITDELLDGDYQTAVITNNFHIYRAVSIARVEGFENVFHIHAGLQWYNLASCYLRESLAVLKMWVFG